MQFHPFQSGLVIRKTDNNIFVVASNGIIKVSEINNENGDSIIDSIREGDRFYTPYKKIDSARYTKAIRRPKGFIINDHKQS